MKMKRLLPILLALSMSLTACAGGGKSETSSDSTESMPMGFASSAEEADAEADTEADAQPGQSEASDSDQTAAEPEITPSQAPIKEADAEPASSEPEAAEIDASEPESAEPEAAEIDASEPESAEPDSSESESAEPEGGEAEKTEDGVISEDKPDYTALYGEYNKIIRAHGDLINAYDWQTINWENDDMIKMPAYNVALADVYGDEAPELLYMVAQESASGYYSVANLVIVTKENGEIKTLYDEALDAQVAGGTYFCVFKLKDRKEPVIYKDIGDEGWTYFFSDLVLRDGVFEKQDRALEEVYPNEDYSEWVSTYTLDGSEVSKDDYVAYKNDLISRIDTFLFFGDMTDEGLIASKDQVGCLAVSYDDAVTMLEELSENYKLDQSAAEPSESSAADAESLFASLKTYDFFFASGAGGWSTDLTLSPDGSITGSYHDSEMGATGEGYPNGSFYFCSFSGRFTNITKLDDYTYSMTIADLVTGNEEGEQFIEDDILYIASAPYGIDGGKTFLLCLPGKPMSELTEDAASWYSMPRAIGDDLPETLPCYGIVNQETQQGFFSGDV